jgi:teichuronic acid exporter
VELHLVPYLTKIDCDVSNPSPLDSQSIYRAIRWSMVGKFSSQIVSWAATILVIRLLSPADYGLIAMAGVVTGLASLLNEAGLNEVIIRVKTLNKQFQREVLTLVLAVNASLFAVVVMSTPFVAKHFDSPELVAVLPVLSLQFLFNALSTLPVSLLERELKLKRLSLVEWSSAVTSAIVSLSMAYLGFGYWALVVAAVLASFLRFFMATIVANSVLIPSFKLNLLLSELHFAKFVLLNKLFWQLSTIVDDYIIGRMLNKEALGHFAVAKTLSLMVLQKIAPILHQVTFPIFSRDMSLLDRNDLLLKGIWLLAIVTFPVLVAVHFLAEPLVLLLFGQNWIVAGQLIEVLVIAVPIKILNNILGNVVSAIGFPKSRMKAQICLFVLIAMFVTLGVYFHGIVGAAIGWTCAHLVFFPIMLWLYNRILRLSLRSLIATVGNNFLPLFLMMVFMSKLPQLYYQQSWYGVLLQLIGGVGTYFVATYILNRSVIKTIAKIIR